MTSTFYIHRNTRETLSFRGILAGFLRVTALVKISIKLAAILYTIAILSRTIWNVIKKTQWS